MNVVLFLITYESCTMTTLEFRNKNKGNNQEISHPLTVKKIKSFTFKQIFVAYGGAV